MRNALLILVVLSVGIAFALLRPSVDEQGGVKTVLVERGSLSLDAVAVGRVEAAYEVPVKSNSGGVLTRRFVVLGQLVQEGDPLCEVRPVLTEQQKLRAERALLGASEAELGAMELSSGETIAGATMRFFRGVKSAERLATSAERARSDAEKQLELLLNGSAEIDGMTIDYIIRAPIDGRVIALDLEVGEPVVPSSSYGSGTELVVLADLDHPVFRGTIDEIEVGRLREGMAAEVTIGARPDLVLGATLEEISLKAETKNNAVVFPVELTVEPPEGLVMRSGYSAVARIRIEEITGALILPERVVEFRDGRAFVLLAGDGEPREVEVQVGLSDSLRIEIRDGLQEGQSVLERSY